jgi:transposase
VANNLVMSQQERDKAAVVKEVDKGRLSARDAADRLGLCRRQVFRLLKRYRTEGDAGLVHRLRGTSSNHGYAKRLKTQVIALYWRPEYRDYGPTQFTEILASDHKIRVDHETARRWLMAAGGTNLQRKKRPHRSKRPRRSAIGDMVQFDGSDHDWFEGRGPSCTLLHMIDDATSRAFLRFAPSENTADCLRIFRAYCVRYGIPRSTYTDRNTVYYGDNGSLTDFSRAMQTLGVLQIFANSAQAKGRVERGNRTHQDRLIKALRREGISTIAAANRFLERRYLEQHNVRFAEPPDGLPDVHRPLPEDLQLDSVFCFQTDRYLRHDFTITLDAVYIQILKGSYTLPRPTQHLIVRRYLDDSLHIFNGDEELRFKILPGKPAPRKIQPFIQRPNHPWKVARLIGKGKLKP